MNVYDNAITRFKKDLWNLCLSMKVFDNIDESKVEESKKIFENVVSNYQSQILQQEEGNENFLKQTLLSQINNDLQILKQVSRDSINQNNKNNFDLKLEEKQNEFNDLMKKDVPPTPKFSDDNKEEPINEENLDLMIKQQMKEREQVMNLNDKESNIIVSSNEFTNPPSKEKTTMIQHEPLNNDKSLDELKHKIDMIELQLKIQTNTLQKIVQSQIRILQKIK